LSRSGNSAPEYLRRFPDANQLPAAPESFTYPFHYHPHPLAKMAAHLLMDELEQTKILQHHFDPTDPDSDYGKMFGVLIVETTDAQLGYLAAFSGKIGGTDIHPGFAPPVFDFLNPKGFFRKEEAVINLLHQKIEALQQEKNRIKLEIKWEELQKQAGEVINSEKNRLKIKKQLRDLQRKNSNNLSEINRTQLFQQLENESARDHFLLKDLKKYWQRMLLSTRKEMETNNSELETLTQERRTRSAKLQKEIFSHFRFLNGMGEEKNLEEIFPESPPPSGAGACAAPKLLQAAFIHHLKPLCMAEFWWGKSPPAEVRTHRHFYPACKSKCAPILDHMLKGIPCDKNPLHKLPTPTAIPILWEDEHLLVLNKPTALCSVPGKETSDSVQEYLQRLYPDIRGPMMVHRLDMHTSGLLLVAKNEDSYRNLQQQFINKTIQKRYTAILDGTPNPQKGCIELPLRVDLEDRPRQMVCFSHGKAAKTHFHVITQNHRYCLTHFFPVTGRTHQIRVHAAHADGLGCPIVGDDLYGTPSDRLYLHADHLLFVHPKTGKKVEIHAPPPFNLNSPLSP
jgi:tRNA pseudouridine32 synthase/23S rRNA pseudouridine746 synthase